MAITFPTTIDTLTNPASTDTLASPSHSDQHINANDAIEALETKVGADSSAVTSSLDYKVTNSSSSNPGHKHTLADGATDVTASKDELNIMDGVTANKDEINQLDGNTFGGTTSGDVVTIDDTQTLTNKTIDADSNTISNIGSSEIENGIIDDQTAITSGESQDQILLTDDSDSDALKKTTLQALGISDMSKEISPSILRIVDSFEPTVSGNMQGIGTDDTYLYVSTDTHLYKYNQSGAVQDSADISGYAHDGGYSGACCVVGDTVYVIAHDTESPSGGWVQEFETSTLDYVTEHALSVTSIGGIGYYEDAFWVIRDSTGNQVYKLASDWTVDETYTVYNSDIVGTYKFQGITFDGDYAYCNIHENSFPPATRLFYFNGTEFIFKENIRRPNDTSQGLCILGDYVWGVTREATPRVVQMARVPYENSSDFLATDFDDDAYSVTSTSYVVPTNYAGITIDVHDGDLIRVDVEAISHVDTGLGRWYIGAATGETGAITYANAPSVRVSNDTSTGQTNSIFKYFRADGDDQLTFTIFALKTTSGTLTIEDICISAQVVGRYNSLSDGVQ